MIYLQGDKGNPALIAAIAVAWVVAAAVISSPPLSIASAQNVTDDNGDTSGNNVTNTLMTANK